jgi:hypothetical protein
VEKAKIHGRDAFASAEHAQQTGRELGRILDQFDASRECREVTCLYNSVNWWLEELIDSPEEVDFEGEERGDFFL